MVVKTIALVAVLAVLAGVCGVEAAGLCQYPTGDYFVYIANANNVGQCPTDDGQSAVGFGTGSCSTWIGYGFACYGPADGGYAYPATGYGSSQYVPTPFTDIVSTTAQPWDDIGGGLLYIAMFASVVVVLYQGYRMIERLLTRA